MRNNDGLFVKFQIDSFPMLSHIIDCFTSLEQLLYFANAHGLQDDPYVQFRIQYLRTRGEASALQMKCHWCERVFCTRQELELHELQHSTIADFDLSLFDYLPPTTVEMSTQKTERLVGRKRNHADIDARCTVQEVDGSPHKEERSMMTTVLYPQINLEQE